MKVANMTVEELRILIKQAVQEELKEIFGDPDTGHMLRPEIEERIRASLASTERIPFDEVKKRLSLS